MGRAGGQPPYWAAAFLAGWVAEHHHLLRGLTLRSGGDYDRLGLVDRMDVAWATLVEWQPELFVHEGLLASMDRRLGVAELARRVAAAPGPLAAEWGGPDPEHAAGGTMAMPASTRRPPAA